MEIKLTPHEAPDATDYRGFESVLISQDPRHPCAIIFKSLQNIKIVYPCWL